MSVDSQLDKINNEVKEIKNFTLNFLQIFFIFFPIKIFFCNEVFLSLNWKNSVFPLDSTFFKSEKKLVLILLGDIK